MKTRVVIFHDTGARILKGVDPTPYRHIPNVLIDPELPAGVPPHLWKLEGGKIVELSEEERIAREALIQAPSEPSEKIVLVKSVRWFHYVLMFVTSTLAATAVQLILERL